MREESDTIATTDEAVAAISVSALLHLARHQPGKVLAAEHIDKDEKRATLASWASDQFAIESVPALRHYRGTERAVSYDEIRNALKALDEDPPSPHDPAAAMWNPRRPRPQDPLTGIAKKLNIRNFWKGECAPTTADV